MDRAVAGDGEISFATCPWHLFLVLQAIAYLSDCSSSLVLFLHLFACRAIPSDEVIAFIVSAVEQEKSEKAGQDPEHGTENCEPEGDIPVCLVDDRDFPGECFRMRCHKV